MPTVEEFDNDRDRRPDERRRRQSESRRTTTTIVTLTAFLLQGKAGHYSSVFEKYQQKAEYFMCSCIGKGTNNVQRSPGGMIFHQRWNNLQYVTSASFLTTVYSDYLQSSRRNVQCSLGTATPSKLFSFAQSQVDYILGDNPRATSYMVGYGSTYPQQVHHRGSSIVSIKENPLFVSCGAGFATWFRRKASDPNLLDGAIVGGPDAFDNFADERENYAQTEPTTYNNSPLVGVLARLNGGKSEFNQLFSGDVPLPTEPVVSQKPTPPSPVTTKPSSPSPFTIEQTTTTSWNSMGRTYYRYAVTVTNKSMKTAKNLNLSRSDLYGPLWGLKKSGNSYGFPAWLDSLSAGKSLEFVYIHSAPPASVSVSGYTLV